MHQRHNDKLLFVRSDLYMFLILWIPENVILSAVSQTDYRSDMLDPKAANVQILVSF